MCPVRHDARRLLADWLIRRPQDFASESMQDAVAWLLETARMVLQVERQHAAHRVRWTLVPEAARRLASRRQMAALAARLAMRGGMERSAAVAWVIGLAGMTRRDFQQASTAVLRPGDRLQVWQWQELRALGLSPDFNGRRQLERWLDLEEPWLFDPRWAFPLHLVDGDVLAALGMKSPVNPDEDHANT